MISGVPVIPYWVKSILLILLVDIVCRVYSIVGEFSFLPSAKLQTFFDLAAINKEKFP